MDLKIKFHGFVAGGVNAWRLGPLEPGYPILHSRQSAQYRRCAGESRLSGDWHSFTGLA
jgi:hypothetical protein